MSQHTPPNPLPCGCAAKGRQDLENAYDDGHCLRVGYKDIHVAHCPLHAAASELLAAAKKVLADLNARIDAASAAGEPVPVFGGIAALYAAIAKAESQS